MAKPGKAQLDWLEKLAAMGGGVQTAAPLAGSLNLPDGQQVAQGDFVSRQVAKLVSQPKIPSPKEAAEKYDAKQKPKPNPPAAEDNSFPATKFEPSKSAVDEDDGRLSDAVEYKKLPSALQAKLSQQFWAGLGTRQRRTLIETYRRLKQYGVWDYIKRVTGEKEHPERHVKLFGFEFETDGNSGGLTYEATDAAGLVKKLRATGHFGEDGKIMGLMHSGQSSYREEPKGARDPRGAHISVGPKNKIDAHIDKHAPVGKPSDGKTRVDPARAWRHGMQEIIPEAVRKLARGFPIKPTVSVGKSPQDPDITEVKVVGVELRGPVKKEKKKLSSKPVVPNPAPQDAQERIAKRVERTKNYFPIPIGKRPEEVPEPKMIATKLAAKLLEAARNGKTSVEFDLAWYKSEKNDKNVKEDQPAALKMMREIGQIVRSELGPQVEEVRRLTVTFGSPKQGGTVSLED